MRLLFLIVVVASLSATAAGQTCDYTQPSANPLECYDPFASSEIPCCVYVGFPTPPVPESCSELGLDCTDVQTSSGNVVNLVPASGGLGSAFVAESAVGVVECKMVVQRCPWPWEPQYLLGTCFMESMDTNYCCVRNVWLDAPGSCEVGP